MGTINYGHNYYDGTGKPAAGQIVKGPYGPWGYVYRVFDGENWHEINEEAIQDLSSDEIQKIVFDRKTLSPDYIEQLYPDLRFMREEQELAYDTLYEKYKVFEILKKVNGGGSSA